MVPEIYVFGIRGFPNVQGGSEKHSEQLYPRLVRLGCGVTVFARKGYLPRDGDMNEWQGVKFVRLPHPKRLGFEAFLHSALAAVQCVKRRPDLVHVHNMGPGLMTGLLKLCRRKVVLTYHSVNYQHQKWGPLAKAVLKVGEFISVNFADCVIVVSQATKKFLQAKYPGRRFEVIHNGVEPVPPLPPGPTLARFDLSSRPYVFTASRFTPEKGLHDLVAAYARLNNPPFALVIAGDADHETDYTKTLRAQAGDTPGIVLTGYLNGQPLIELFSNAALFVLPSHYEGLPIALLEAMSFGIPALVSDIPAHREIGLADHRYFPPGDVATLAEKMTALAGEPLSDEERRQHAELIRRDYNWDRIADQTKQVYLSVLQ